jgi:hypothetical protein
LLLRNGGVAGAAGSVRSGPALTRQSSEHALLAVFKSCEFALSCANLPRGQDRRDDRVRSVSSQIFTFSERLCVTLPVEMALPPSNRDKEDI